MLFALECLHIYIVCYEHYFKVMSFRYNWTKQTYLAKIRNPSFSFANMTDEIVNPTDRQTVTVAEISFLLLLKEGTRSFYFC